MRSAYQLAYALIFLVAVKDLLSRVFWSDNPLSAGATAASASLRQLGYDIWIINGLAYAVPTFAVFFSLHLIRIYITMEYMEDEEGGYENFYDGYSPAWRFTEFVVRVIIIGIVSLKVIKVHEFRDFASYVFLFYLSLCAWSAIALMRKKKFFYESFAFSSLLGLCFGGILLFLRYEPSYWQGGMLFLWLACAALAADIGIYVWLHGKKVVDEYWVKIVSPW
jgi:hypothetical protein